MEADGGQSDTPRSSLVSSSIKSYFMSSTAGLPGANWPNCLSSANNSYLMSCNWCKWRTTFQAVLIVCTFLRMRFDSLLPETDRTANIVCRRFCFSETPNISTAAEIEETNSARSTKDRSAMGAGCARPSVAPTMIARGGEGCCRRDTWSRAEMATEQQQQQQRH